MDVSGSIQGSFNQAHQAAHLTEAEKARTRKAEQDRLRDARRQYIATHEEVAQTQTLSGSQVEPNREPSDGEDARDQYEEHDLLASSSDRRDQYESSAAPETAADARDHYDGPVSAVDDDHIPPAPPRTPPAARFAAPVSEPSSDDDDSGHLVDVEA